MISYSLQPDEIILFSGKASYRFAKDETLDSWSGKKMRVDVLLTNLSLVIQARRKSLFSEEEIRTFEIPLDEMKEMDERPAYRMEGESKVHLYFIRNEITLDFDDLITARKFENALLNTTTGTTALQRTANMAGKAVAGFVGSMVNGLQNRPASPGSSFGAQKAARGKDRYAAMVHELFEAGFVTGEEMNTILDRIRR